MKSVYACSRGEKLAAAIDMTVISDPKVIGAFLKLAGESGLVVDRVEPGQVMFLEPELFQTREVKKDDKQIEIDFSSSTGDKLGPSEMGEGFTCNYSGACPHENKSCSNCEYAGSIFQKAENPPAEAATEEKPEGNGLVEEVQGAEFMQWASMSPEEREAAGVPEPGPIPGNEPEETDEWVSEVDGLPVLPDDDGFESPCDEPEEEPA